jgi:hypothetical protein
MISPGAWGKIEIPLFIGGELIGAVFPMADAAFCRIDQDSIQVKKRYIPFQLVINVIFLVI